MQSRSNDDVLPAWNLQEINLVNPTFVLCELCESLGSTLVMWISGSLISCFSSPGFCFRAHCVSQPNLGKDAPINGLGPLIGSIWGGIFSCSCLSSGMSLITAGLHAAPSTVLSFLPLHGRRGPVKDQIFMFRPLTRFL